MARFSFQNVQILASAGDGGAISPSGEVSVNYGADQTFTITPNAHYHVADVLVDGVSVGAVTSYTCNNVVAAHTIAASFTIDEFFITASAGLGGSITPPGTVRVFGGSNQSFAITPGPNYNIKDVRVDGISIGPASSYTFTDVISDHNISANFIAKVINIMVDRNNIKVPYQKTAKFQVTS